MSDKSFYKAKLEQGERVLSNSRADQLIKASAMLKETWRIPVISLALAQALAEKAVTVLSIDRSTRFMGDLDGAHWCIDLVSLSEDEIANYPWGALTGRED